MALGDLVALVAGVAFAFAAIPSESIGGFFVVPPFWLAVVFLAGRIGQGLTMIAATLAVGRVVSYRRMPRAAEWLAIVVTAGTLAARPEFNIDGWVNLKLQLAPFVAPGLDFDGLRWLMAGLFLLPIAILGGAFHLGRGFLHCWVKTLLLGGMAVLAVAGPLWVFGFLGDDLVSPREGFGAGDLAILHRQVCVLFGFFPTGVFFGVPAVATLLERLSSRAWSWVEWAGAATSASVALTQAMLFRGEFVDVSPAWAAERALVLVWLILIRFGDRWRRWTDGQDRSSSA
jgi:hypothetical protein